MVSSGGRLRAALRRVGSRDAISWPVFWATLAAGVIGNAVSNASGVPPLVLMLVVVLGQCVLWAPLALVGMTLRRNPARFRPLLVSGALVGSLMARALVLGGLFGSLVGPDQVKWMNRVSGALLNVGLVFVLAAIFTSVVRERRRQISRLRSLQSSLAASLDEVSSYVTERNEQAVTEVQSVLLAQLQALDPDDAGSSLAVLQRTAADVVRPMSHELANSLPAMTEPGLVEVQSEVPWREVIDDAATGSPFRPAATAGLMSVAFMAGTVVYPAGALVFVALGLLLIGLLFVANLVLHPLLHGRSRRLRISAVLFMALLVAVSIGACCHALLPSSTAHMRLAIGIGFYVFIFSLGVSVATAFGADRERVLRELQAAFEAQERRLVQLRQVQWFQQKSLSRALHGPVQTAVTAAALRLDSAIRGGDGDPELVETVRAELLAVLDVLQSPDSATLSLDDALARNIGMWEGLCEVTVDVDECIEGLLLDNTPLRACVIDIVTEAISNAVRHGGASQARVAIDVMNERDLQLEVDSDSEPQEGRLIAGLGTRLLDECTTRWWLDRTPQGMRLGAVLPCGA